MPSRPASSKKKKSKTPLSPKITEYISGRLNISEKLNSSPIVSSRLLTFNASPIVGPRLLTFQGSPISSTKKRHTRAAKKLQGLFRGYRARKMTKKISNAAKKMQALFRGRLARNRTGRMRNERREKKQKSEKKKEGMVSRMMKKLNITTLPDVSAPRTLRSYRPPTSRLMY